MSTEFLYPFLDGDGVTADRPTTDRDALIADLVASCAAKRAQSTTLRAATLAEHAATLADAAAAMAGRFRAGATLFTFGNGGSATDAASVAALFARHPARNLAEDPAVLTALGNDLGFDRIFSRQLVAHARPGDIALGISTSGASRDVLDALSAGRARGLYTIALVGADRIDDADVCLTVASDSVHRIQETHAALATALWERVDG